MFNIHSNKNVLLFISIKAPKLVDKCFYRHPAHLNWFESISILSLLLPLTEVKISRIMEILIIKPENMSTTSLKSFLFTCWIKTKTNRMHLFFCSVHIFKIKEHFFSFSVFFLAGYSVLAFVAHFVFWEIFEIEPRKARYQLSHSSPYWLVTLLPN